MARVFAQQMADELKVTLEEISFEKYWSERAPDGWRKYPLEKFMKEVCCSPPGTNTALHWILTY